MRYSDIYFIEKNFYSCVDYVSFIEHIFGNTYISYSRWVPEFVYGDNELLENIDSDDAIQSFFGHSKTA